MPAHKAPDFTRANLLAAVAYDPDTGIFVRKIATCHNPAGTTMGSPTRQGYLRIVVLGRQVLAHRLAWFYVHGVWPSKHIDHKNGIKTDNWIDNLRDVTPAVNMQNRQGATVVNAVGVIGVTPKAGRFAAQIQTNGANRHIGYFDTAEEAGEAYLSAKRQLHEGCTL